MDLNREYGTIKVPTSLVSHIMCVFVAVALIVIASIYSTPEITYFNGIVPLHITPEWYSSNIALGINMVLMILLVVITSTIANKYSLTTLHSVLPTLFLLMLQCCNTTLQTSLNIGIFGAFTLLVSTLYLFENYGCKQVEKSIYGITLILCATTLLWNKIVFFIPLFWLGMGQLNMLTIKSAFASIFALATSTFIFWGLSYLGWCNFDFTSSWEEIKSVVMLNDYEYVTQSTLSDVLYIIPILMVIVVYNLTNLYADSREKISIKRYIQFLNSILVTTILLIAMNPLSITSYMPIFNVVTALLSAHYFNSIKSKIKLRFLYSIILIYITMYVVWIL